MKKKKVMVLLAGAVLVVAAGALLYVLQNRKLKATANKDTITDLLNQYDAEGAFLVNEGIANGDDISQFYSETDPAVNVTETVVHEECHEYSKVNDEDERLYMGDGESITVPFTEIFHTKKMSGSIPEDCRTFRYDTYVSEPSDGLMANVNGVYGLLNEYCAYSWGMNDNICMFDYFDRFPDTTDTWSTWISLGASNRLAGYEFRYFILHYLYYAKKHAPKVYEGIVANDEFRAAYVQTEERFDDLIAKYEDDLEVIKGKLERKGMNVEYEDHAFFVVTGGMKGSGANLDLLYDMCDLLIQEMEKPRYQKIEEALRQ